MKKNFDLLEFYGIAFSLLSKKGDIIDYINNISSYTETDIVLLDNNNNVITSSSWDRLSASDMCFYINLEERTKQFVLNPDDKLYKGLVNAFEEDYFWNLEFICSHGNRRGACIIFSKISNITDEGDYLATISHVIGDAAETLSTQNRFLIHSRQSEKKRVLAANLFECEHYDSMSKGDQYIIEQEVRAPYCMIMAEMARYNTIQFQEICNHLIDKYPQALIHTKEHLIMMLIPDIIGNTQYQYIVKEMKMIAESYRLVACMSMPFDKVCLVPNKRAMFVKTLEIGKRQEKEYGLFMEYDFYLQVVCSLTMMQIGKSRFMEEELQSLKKYDQSKHTDFYKSLKEYLFLRNNVTATATKLHIHRNTMFYRLAKLNELLMVDVNEPEIAQKLAITIALQEEDDTY